MADDPFRSPKQRLARAQEKIAELKAAIETFVNTEKPYQTIAEQDANSGITTYKVVMTKALPDILSNLSMEIAEALRSALDQAGFACAVLAGTPNPKHAYFPMSDTGPQLADVIKGRCKELPTDIVNLFRSFTPYQGGNDALWALNKIANTKHTVLAPVGTMAGGIVVKKMTLQGVEIPVPRWDGAKNEMIFARVRPGGKFDYDLNFSFYIAFGEASPLAGHPVLTALRKLQGEVAGILAATEAECRRIGLLKS